MKDRRIQLTKEQRDEMIEAMTWNNPIKHDEGHSTLCNHVRYLYSLTTTDEQKELCHEIMFMAKKIDLRLREYIVKYGRLPKNEN